MKLQWAFIFLGLVRVCGCYNILMLVTMPTVSHYNLFKALSERLIERGHHVTLISAHKREEPIENLTEVIIENSYDAISQNVFDEKQPSFVSMQISPWKGLLLYPKLGLVLSEHTLESLQKIFLKDEHHFDLLVTESFLSESTVAGLAYKYQTPTIAISSFMPNHWANYMVGNIAPWAYIPDPFLGYTDEMNFFERVTNTLFSILQELSYSAYYLPKQDKLLKKYFGSDVPPIDKILRNTSVVLVNHHHSLAFPRPYVANMIEIGGYHVKPPKALPKDLEKLVNEANHGVVFFSMGSHLKSSHMPKELIHTILNTFRRLKQTVIWKFEDSSLTDVPQNVKIMKWVPQTDLLAHPNVKLFVTHGGLLSTTEAVMLGVPLVGLPVMGDQHVNMKFVEKAGFAVMLKLEDLNEDNFHSAIHEVLNNPRYLENIRRRSRIFKDRPLSSIDTALYWIEYVVRHNGASHLRSTAQRLPWYQLYLLDVFGFMLIFSVSCVYVLFRVVKYLRMRLFGDKSPDVSPTKKEN